LLFNELKLRSGLEMINTTDAYTSEALIIVTGISLLISYVTVDMLLMLEEKRREVKAARRRRVGVATPPPPLFASC
jgi:hypothetical protein